MSEITIKDDYGFTLLLGTTSKDFFFIEVDDENLSFTDPAELKRLAEWILSNLEKEG